MTENKKNKTWVFTINNYELPNDIDTIRAWLPECTRVVVSREVGEGGTPHLQGAIRFRQAKRLSALKKLHGRAHWEGAVSGDPFTYCCKADSIIEINHTDNKQGRRTDLEELCDFMREKKRSRKEIADAHPTAVAKFSKGIVTLMQWQIEPRKFTDEPPEVYWRWGPTGTGKSYGVHVKETDLWVSNENLKWFDGYEGQEAVLIEEFRKETSEYNWLLRLTDRYPLQVPVKGGYVHWVPKRVYITSDRPPTEMWPEEGGRIDQLIRRIKEIQHITTQSSL